MTDEEKRKSYERYKQWQYNKNRYQYESIAYVVLFAICFFAFFKYGVIVLSVGAVIIIYRVFKKNKDISYQDKKSGATKDREKNTNISYR